LLNMLGIVFVLLFQRDKLGLRFVDGIAMIFIEEVVQRILYDWVAIHMNILFINTKSLIDKCAGVSEAIRIDIFIYKSRLNNIERPQLKRSHSYIFCEQFV
jgi:hypothetical protein